MHPHLRWEVDFERKQGRRPRSGDRSGSHYYTETYKKRAELRAQISNLSANEDPAAGGSRGGGKRGSSSRSRERGGDGDGAGSAHGAAADPAKGGAAALSSKAAKDAAALAAKAGGEVPAEAERMSEAAMGQAVELFKKYDGDGDGVLGYSEFFELMKETPRPDPNPDRNPDPPPPPRPPPLPLTGLNFNRNPNLPQELAQLAGRKHDPMALRALFHQLDADNSREVTGRHSNLGASHRSAGRLTPRPPRALSARLHGVPTAGLQRLLRRARAARQAGGRRRRWPTRGSRPRDG